MDHDLVEIASRVQPIWLFFDKTVEAARYEALNNIRSIRPIGVALARLTVTPSDPSRKSRFRNHELEVLRDLRNAGAHLGHPGSGLRSVNARQLKTCILSHLRPSGRTPFRVKRCSECYKPWTLHELLIMAKLRIGHIRSELLKAEQALSSATWSKYAPLWETFCHTTIYRPSRPSIFALHAIMAGL